MRGTLGNRGGGGDYALLNVDRIEYISLVINAFEIFFNFFWSTFVPRTWSILVFRKAK